jgi:eukaryotic-like serine/threonine-protein kinase
LTMFSVEQHARKFKADGVTESDIRSVVESVKKSTNHVDVSTDKTIAIKNEVVDRFDLITQEIDKAYRN